jgi:acyl phosphate:glycerol-3-phosphate acyltransferase
MLWLMFIGVTILAYLIGAIPVGGIIAGLKGIDLRKHGSGKLGTTNVLRTIGRRAAALVLVGDFLKGSLAVGLAKLIASAIAPEGASLGWPGDGVSVVTMAMVLAAVASIVGHLWSIYMRVLTGEWGGGRGVATSLGASLVIHPLITIIALAVGIPTIIISRYVSLGSILGSLAGGVVILLLVLLGQLDTLSILFVSLVVVVVLAHHDNIQRLLKGTERKFGESAKA